MDYNNIKNLLDKFLNGNTTIEEEKSLNAFFTNQREIPDEFAYAKMMFNYFESEKVVTIPVKNIKVFRKSVITITSIAASVAIVLTLGFLHTSSKQKKVYCYINGEPVHNKEIAMIETQKALTLVTNNLNCGLNEFSELSKLYTTKQIIFKTK